MSGLNICEKTDCCRYADILEAVVEKLNGVEILYLEYVSNYQGDVDIAVLLEDGRVFTYEYSYGSCFGCDDWEARELSDEEIENEMIEGAAIFKDRAAYDKFAKGAKNERNNT